MPSPQIGTQAAEDLEPAEENVAPGQGVQEDDPARE